MKYSIYTSIIYICDKHTICYNAFTGKFVVLRGQKLNLKGVSVDCFRKKNANVYNQFIEAGIIINDNVDEIALLKDSVRQADNNRHEYILHINPTLDCNLNCWYCYENHIQGSKMKSNVKDSVEKFISSILNDSNIKSFELGFFGGEPLFYFNTIAKEIINHSSALCKQNGQIFHISFTSNGTLLTDEIIDFLSHFSCGFQITLDGGKESHDKTRFYKNHKGSFDKIIRNIHKLVSAGIGVIVRINFTKENIDSIPYILEAFNDIAEEKKDYIKFDFQRVWQDKIKKFDETEQEISLIRKTYRDKGFRVLANYIPHDARNSCYGDKINHLLINYNGDVYGCTARDFNKENSIGYLGIDGTVKYNKEILALRNNSKMSKDICMTCRIAPICGGGCKQRAMEALDDKECIFHYTDIDRDNIILDIFEHYVNTKSI